MAGQRENTPEHAEPPSPSGRGNEGEGKLRLDPELLAFARKLRRNETEAERLLWKLIRNRKLAGFKFRRQHSCLHFVLDFYCHEAALGIELDGGQHGFEGQEAWDTMRTRIIEREGIRILRFWNRTVLKHPEVVMRTIYDALTDATGQPWSAAVREDLPHPGPLPEGEGEAARP